MEVELLSEVDLAPDYFCEIVEPTVAEFLDDRSSKRCGCLAALAIAQYDRGLSPRSPNRLGQ